ncbi:disulfide bond formation protein DsbB [Kouleothrix aurantiaca]|uniref:Disulfide bond formation protein DsbB n=1 Tax=Kouleothrix aurantiaca TaxID=186479 RepID=A0A0P9FNQ7_9CHLR|nr:disulfide bond formation protein DsbB [Kouleothrix aurantiaca]
MDEREAYGATSWIDDLIDWLGATSRHIALLAAWIATCGSLFFSEVLRWQPCVLCWYQRILMYPLAILLAIGIVRRDRGLHVYVLPFSIAGIGVSLYHYLLIKTDWLPPPACTVGVPCTVDYLNWFGFINIPFLALTAFLIITCMMLTFAWLQPLTASAVDGENVTEDGANTRLPVRLDTANLAVVMIIVGVILAFMVGSTFI